MELLRLRKRVTLARKGHRLLKEKEEELLRRLIPLTKEVKELRRRVEDLIKGAFQKFLIARGSMEPEILESILSSTSLQSSIDVTTEPLLNLRLPVFRLGGSKLSEYESHNDVHTPNTYGYWRSSGELDLALDDYTQLLQVLILLAEKEKRLGLLVSELVKTRRRVRALEYRLIPDLEETIDFIQFKLTEVERGNLTRLMKVKERIR
jgi:V/A-type H+-transporting ATPase subunit D